MERNQLKDVIRVLPDSSGVYQFLDVEDKIIYVGKAKNLKARVSSYFQKDLSVSNKLRVMVDKVTQIRHLVTSTESDALLLENNLIKKYQPRYNILLKDDKSFPFICVKREPFPRVFATRNPIEDGSQYFGPYTSMVMVRTLLELVRQLYPLRNCKLSLTQENIAKGKFKVCLEYHLGNCMAPCVRLQEESSYDQNIHHIKNILRGNTNSVLDYLRIQMQQKADKLMYEEAQSLKEKSDILRKFQAKSAIVNVSLNNMDVFSFVEKENRIAINFLHVVNGAVVKTHTVETKRVFNESREEILLHAILNVRKTASSESKEVIVPFDPGIHIAGIRFFVPRKGDKKTLADLSERNAKYFLLEKIKMAELKKPEEKRQAVLRTMMQDLRLKDLPGHIECFDNSNIQGNNPVASCVVFIDAKPAKKEYRHYNIKTVQGIDDFSSMEEVIYRRYKRMLEEKKEMPDLIIVDGGKGQLTSALKGLSKLPLRQKIPLIGIAKRLEEIFFPEDPVPIYLNKNSITLNIIQQIRNEAHRFAIRFHRQKRSQWFTRTELQSIPGIGEKTALRLLSHFKSVREISKLNQQQLAGVIGPSKAILVETFFRNRERGND